MDIDDTSFPPRPYGEWAFRRDLARDAFALRMRKSHGEKGEGVKALKIRIRQFPLTRSEASFAATSPRWGEVRG